MGPSPLYCPVISSAKKMGNPMNTAERKYGRRKAPPPFLLDFHCLIDWLLIENKLDKLPVGQKGKSPNLVRIESKTISIIL
jgi:hypothetical protein